MSGVRLKTRKRNIVVPHDPQSFADAVIAVLADAQESEDLDRTLEAANKILDGAELDFSRYGDVLFEVGFVGGRVVAGGRAGSGAESGKTLDFNILAAEAETEAIVPYASDRRKLAIALARCFVLKVGVLAERVLPTLLEDRLVGRGTSLAFMTDFFGDYLSTDSVESLMETLRRARLEGRLLEFFPQQRRAWAEFDAHFEAAGLPGLVEYNRRKRYESRCVELRAFVAELVASEEGPGPARLLAAVKAKKEEYELADADVLRATFLGLADSVLSAAVGRNQAQIHFGVLKAVKTFSPALARLCATPRLEASLLQTVQVTCYEESRLLKIFKDIVKILYDADVVSESAIRFWYTKGSSPKGRNVFLTDMQPFIKWLDEAEEEEDDEDDE
ncbi:hypothetical protein QBZ16_000572 [Prototheca wickerhamii]|uniref:W2 domain-containing protein n=1 Tax=Prototheca wickerhamii TaxID=3111 RepID=A0AAD9MN50_PROWI|nr:hypothetical protein QBZ16_000572 [Prototheca wickerhamii]